MRLSTLQAESEAFGTRQRRHQAQKCLCGTEENMIGHNIYKIRKQRGLTLTDLAVKTGISKSYLSNIERNLKQNPSIHVMEKIAAVLNVDLKALLMVATHVEMREHIETEWVEMINEYKDTGLDRDRIHEFKMLLEFMKWYNDKSEEKS
jgi:XRE family transcriptional regulator of biofilm formation